jgi:hypothetical protein
MFDTAVVNLNSRPKFQILPTDAILGHSDYISCFPKVHFNIIILKLFFTVFSIITLVDFLIDLIYFRFFNEYQINVKLLVLVTLEHLANDVKDRTLGPIHDTVK